MFSLFIEHVRLYNIFYIFCLKYFIHFEEIRIQEFTNISLKRHHSGKVNAQIIELKLPFTNHVKPVITKFNLENTCTFKNPLY